MAGNQQFIDDYKEFMQTLLGEVFNYVVEFEQTTEKDKIQVLQQIYNTIDHIFEKSQQVT
jgi:hypothetical protein